MTFVMWFRIAFCLLYILKKTHALTFSYINTAYTNVLKIHCVDKFIQISALRIIWYTFHSIDSKSRIKAIADLAIFEWAFAKRIVEFAIVTLHAQPHGQIINTKIPVRYKVHTWPLCCVHRVSDKYTDKYRLKRTLNSFQNHKTPLFSVYKYFTR